MYFLLWASANFNPVHRKFQSQLRGDRYFYDGWICVRIIGLRFNPIYLRVGISTRRMASTLSARSSFNPIYVGLGISTSGQRGGDPIPSSDDARIHEPICPWQAERLPGRYRLEAE